MEHSISISFDKLKCLLEHQDLFDVVADLATSDIVDPCDPDKTREDFLGEIIDNMREDCSLEAFEVAMDGVDKIIPDPTLTACDKVFCIYNDLRSSESDLWCNTIGGFDNIESSVLRPQIGVGNTNLPADYFTTIHPNRRGVTTVNSAGEIVIALNPALCNAVSPLEIAHTILHEGIHADMWRYLQDNWQGDWPIMTEYSYEQTWNLLFDLACRSSDSGQHEQMMESWITELAKGLRDFNNPTDSWEDYRYRALLGIYNANDPCSTSLIDQTLFASYRDNFNENVTESPWPDC